MGYIILAIVTTLVLMARRKFRYRLADLRVPTTCKVASLIVLHGGVLLILAWGEELTPEAPAQTYWVVGLGALLFGIGFWSALIPRRRRKQD